MTMRRLLGGVLVVLLVSGVAGAQTVSTDTPEIAAIRAKANAGDADAQKNLGDAYSKGRGVPQDSVQAVAWYRKAAEQGVADAQWNLGLMYDLGEGVPQDYAQAVAWYRRAAYQDQGKADAQYQLGWMYADGRGVPRDDVFAYMWFHLAASRSSGAQQMLSVENRDRISARLTPQQRADGQRMSREWQEAFGKRGGK